MKLISNNYKHPKFLYVDDLYPHIDKKFLVSIDQRLITCCSILSCVYAIVILQNGNLSQTVRFPEGEPVIAINPYYSYLYAKFVIRGRFELGEPTIAKDAYFSYQYAQSVLKDRFLLGEKTILNDKTYARYASRYLQLFDIDVNDIGVIR